MATKTTQATLQRLREQSNLSDETIDLLSSAAWGTGTREDVQEKIVLEWATLSVVLYFNRETDGKLSLDMWRIFNYLVDDAVSPTLYQGATDSTLKRRLRQIEQIREAVTGREAKEN